MAGEAAADKSKPLSPLQRLEPYMQMIQTAAAVLGVTVATVAVRRFMYPLARPVDLLHPRLRSAGGEVDGVKIVFTVNPYQHLTPKRAVILQGRSQEGKTMLLRTSIPWYRRWRIGGYYGVYLNGAGSISAESFEHWKKSQVFGTTTAAAGAQINNSLLQYWHSQWFRRFLETLNVPLEPKPALVIVDEFEKLLKRYPAQALDWANMLTNEHTRDDLARVIFVVNSDAGAQTLLNLNQGSRFTRVLMEPVSGEVVRGLDVHQFERCKRNIGLYKIVDDEVQRGQLTRDNVDSFVRQAFQRWEEDFQLPYPIKYDRSWRRVSGAEMKDKMKETLETALRSEKSKEGKPKFREEEVKSLMDLAVRAWRVLDPSQILDASEELWAEGLQSAGAQKSMALGLASRIKRVIGNPMPKRSYATSLSR